MESEHGEIEMKHSKTNKRTVHASRMAILSPGEVATAVGGGVILNDATGIIVPQATGIIVHEATGVIVPQ
jgi:hypothetical protein